MKMNSVIGRFLQSVLVVAILAVLFAGCSKNLTANTDALYVPTTSDVTASATLTDLQAGRSIFINSCGRCHNLYSPESYSASNWKSIVPGMASMAGLTTVQASQVTKYVSRGK